MRTNLVALAILAAIFGAALLRAEPADCKNCMSGFQCFTDSVCGNGCSCLRINGLGKAGVCG